MSLVSKVAYKYLEQKHLAGMRELGRLRVGTLHEYRDIETHHIEVGDPDEGRKTEYENPRFMSYDAPESISEFAARFVGRGKAKRVLFQRTLMELEHDLPDFFVYCMSTEPSRHAMLRMGKNVCVKIENSEAFFTHLDVELRRKSLVTGVPIIDRCIYRPRRQAHDPEDRDHPALLKDPRYSYQCEVRGIWAPSTRPLEPQLVDVPGVRDILTVIPL